MRALLGGPCDQRCQARTIGPRHLLAEAVEGPHVVEQTLTPTFSSSYSRFFGVTRFAPSRELRFDGARIDLPHQSTDELELSSSRLSLGEALRFAHGLEELVGQPQRLQAGRV